ncbi:hypothetical protein [Actinomadura physcomitrii]|uniref:hypothetical protein n=1 Tax=Actinomadura physcomitrii TaxID=2650748 RepID=UPI0019212C23|nr:hypothetical protein [Actinomadura physcomitrii]
MRVTEVLGRSRDWPRSARLNRGLTVDQARDALKAAEHERLRALYVLALCLGLRRGDLLEGRPARRLPGLRR